MDEKEFGLNESMESMESMNIERFNQAYANVEDSAVSMEAEEKPFENKAAQDRSVDIVPRFKGSSVDSVSRKSKKVRVVKRSNATKAKSKVKRIKMYDIDPGKIFNNPVLKKKVEKAIKSREYRKKQKEMQQKCFRCNNKKPGLNSMVIEFLTKLATDPQLEGLLAGAKGRRVKVDITFR